MKKFCNLFKLHFWFWFVMIVIIIIVVVTSVIIFRNNLNIVFLTEMLGSVITGAFVAIITFCLTRHIYTLDNKKERHSSYRKEISKFIKYANSSCNGGYDGNTIRYFIKDVEENLDIILLYEIYKEVTEKNSSDLDDKLQRESGNHPHMNLGYLLQHNHYRNSTNFDRNSYLAHFRCISEIYFKEIYRTTEKIGINKHVFLSLLDNDYRKVITEKTE